MSKDTFELWRGVMMSVSLLAGTTAHALGQTTPISQARSATVTAGAGSFQCMDGETNTVSDLAPDFGPWSTNLQVSAFICDGAYEVVRTAVTQVSSMSPSEIRVSSSARSRGLGAPHYTGLLCSGASDFLYEFHLSAPSSYSHSGNFAFSAGEGHGPFGIRLNGPDGLVFEHYPALDGTSGNFSGSGTLAPGNYRIQASYGFSSSGDDTFFPGASVELELVMTLSAPPCPCDWNNDGAATTPDFFAFVEAFFASESDFNLDKVTNSQDFFDFLGCFFAPPGGCA